MSGFHYPVPRARQLFDDERNLLWSLRFEPCDQSDTCPSNYHTDECPLNESEE